MLARSIQREISRGPSQPSDSTPARPVASQPAILIGHASRFATRARASTFLAWSQARPHEKTKGAFVTDVRLGRGAPFQTTRELGRGP